MVNSLLGADGDHTSYWNICDIDFDPPLFQDWLRTPDLDQIKWIFGLKLIKIAMIKFIPMRQQSRQRNTFFSSRFTSNLMLPACLVGMILVVNADGW